MWGAVGARSAVSVVRQPYPVVFDAFVNALPTRGFRVTGVDRERGRITLTTRNTRFVLAVGAIDAITSQWVVTAELKFGMFRERHERHLRNIGEALDAYLGFYYPSAV